MLLSQSKEEVTTGTAYPAGTVEGTQGAASEFDGEANSTTASIGIGLKFKSLSIDAALSGVSDGTANQKINATDFMSQVGAVYTF